MTGQAVNDEPATTYETLKARKRAAIINLRMLAMETRKLGENLKSQPDSAEKQAGQPLCRS